MRWRRAGCGWPALVAADGRRLRFADDLPATIAGAQARMERLLRTIDGYLAHRGGEGAGPADPPAPFTAPAGPVELDLRRAGIGTVIWATGYQPAYPWLRVPVLDRHGEIAHHRGVTSVPGLYVLGLKFLYRRNSTFIDGVASRRPVRGRPRDDAADDRPRPERLMLRRCQCQRQTPSTTT